MKIGQGSLPSMIMINKRVGGKNCPELQLRSLIVGCNNIANSSKWAQ